MNFLVFSANSARRPGRTWRAAAPSARRPSRCRTWVPALGRGNLRAQTPARASWRPRAPRRRPGARCDACQRFILRLPFLRPRLVRELVAAASCPTRQAANQSGQDFETGRRDQRGRRFSRGGGGAPRARARRRWRRSPRAAPPGPGPRRWSAMSGSGTRPAASSSAVPHRRHMHRAGAAAAADDPRAAVAREPGIGRHHLRRAAVADLAVAVFGDAAIALGDQHVVRPGGVRDRAGLPAAAPGPMPQLAPKATGRGGRRGEQGHRRLGRHAHHGPAVGVEAHRATTGRPVVTAPWTAASTSSAADMVSIHSTSTPPAARAWACSAKAAVGLVHGQGAQRHDQLAGRPDRAADHDRPAGLVGHLAGDPRRRRG